jgi:branched-subunit amino acid permease
MAAKSEEHAMTTGTAMSTQPSDDSMADIFDEVGSLAVGLGIMAFALFPLSVPVLMLLLPLAIPLVALALVAGLLAAPIALVRGLRRASAG